MALAVNVRARVGELALDVDITVKSGECLAIVGPSGAGKTSILRSIAGLMKPQWGYIRCGDQSWFDSARKINLPPDERSCGYLFQEYALFPHLRVWQNVAYGIRDGRSRREEAKTLLSQFGVDQYMNRFPRELSGGEQQRVALARALACDPDVLLLDEPTAALDDATREASLDQLGNVLRSLEVPTVLVTHDLEDAAELDATVATLEGGRLTQRRELVGVRTEW